MPPRPITASRRAQSPKPQSLSPAAFLMPFVKTSNGLHVMTIARRKDLRIGFVGGKLENGESPRDAAVRECQEEIGFAVPKDQIKYFGMWTLKDGRRIHMYTYDASSDLSDMMASANQALLHGTNPEISGVQFNRLPDIMTLKDRFVETMEEVLITLQHRQ